MDSPDSKQVKAETYSRHANEISCSIKCMIFIELLRKKQLLTKGRCSTN